MRNDNISARLSKTSEEADALKPVIADLLNSVSEVWAEFDLHAFTSLQDHALFLLIAAGLVERRGWVRCEMIGHPIPLEVRFQATGEGGLAKALEYSVTAMYEVWGESYRLWREEHQETKNLFHAESQKPHEWRLTSDGVLARSDLNTKNPDHDPQRVFDFVLKCGFYGPLHGFRIMANTLASPEVQGNPTEITLDEHLVSRPRPPVLGDGRLLEFRKVERPLGPQPVTIANWKEGTDQIAEVFSKNLQASFETFWQKAKEEAASLVKQVGKTAPPQEPAAPTYLYADEGAFFRIRFNGETGTIRTDLKGAQYIFAMLQQPNKVFLANELHAVVAQAERKATLPEEFSEEPAPESHRLSIDEGELLDLRLQLSRTKADLERAQVENDTVEVAHCQEQIEALLKRIREMTSLGGKLRGTDLSERLGKSVAKSINLVIRYCKQKYHLPKLAEHLDTSLDRGRTCSYRPAPPMPEWKF